MSSSVSPYFSESSLTKMAANKFPNPFFDIASEYIPIEIVNILEWSEYLYLTMGTYRAASRRVVRYFLTEIMLDGESEDERDKFQDFLNDELHMLTQLAEIGDDFMTYGNVFVSVYFPFYRFLICPKCGTNYRDDVIDYKFNTKAVFTAKCQKCAYDGEFDVEDRRSADKKKIKIVRWNPKEIKIRIHPVSGRTKYFWQINPLFLKKLEEGDKFYVQDTPKAILDCIKNEAGKTGVKLFEFDETSLYHMKEQTLAGLPIFGWGLPPILPNFKLAYYIQVLRRYDEAIAFDYIIPFRIIYPEVGPSPDNDGIMHMAMQSFKSRIAEMVADHRRDPTHIQVAPFKIGYQTAGGEGKMLAPKESIALAIDELLNAVGFPAELYKGSLSIQAFPVALRLFEKTWGSLVDGYNDLIRWILKRISNHLMIGEITGKLRSVTLADDLERKALSLQAAAGQDISKGTAYMPLGLDYMEEQRRIIEEQQAIQKLQREAMEESQAQQAMGQGGGAPQGDPNAAPGGQPGATPGDVYEQSKQLAQQLLFQTPETMRRGELIKIRHSNPTLHALVMQEMDNLRQEMARQGGAQMMQQAQQQGGMTVQAEAKDLPSPMYIAMMIAEDICNTNRGDLRKMAMAIKNEEPGAKMAFHYVYYKINGWK